MLMFPSEHMSLYETQPPTNTRTHTDKHTLPQVYSSWCVPAVLWLLGPPLKGGSVRLLLKHCVAQHTHNQCIHVLMNEFLFIYHKCDFHQ